MQTHLRTRALRRTGATLSLAIVLIAIGTEGAHAAKVDVCHKPPGNPTNWHTISVSTNAVAAHLGHGDLMGSCESNCNTLCDDGDLCTQDVDLSAEHCACMNDHPLVDCNDGVECTADSCTSALGCTNTSTCLNGGTCEQSQPGATCECPAGYTGANCETPTGPSCPCDASEPWQTALANPISNACPGYSFPSPCGSEPDHSWAFSTVGDALVRIIGGSQTGQMGTSSFCGIQRHDSASCGGQDFLVIFEIAPAEAAVCRAEIDAYAAGESAVCH